MSRFGDLLPGELRVGEEPTCINFVSTIVMIVGRQSLERVPRAYVCGCSQSLVLNRFAFASSSSPIVF